MVDKTFTADAILVQDGITKTFTAGALLTKTGTMTLGSLVLIVDDDGIEPKYFKRTAKHSILGATNSKRQHTGSDSTQYEIEGVFEGATRDADMEKMKGYYTNNTEVYFKGYTSIAVKVRIIEFRPVDLITYWVWRIIVEETGNP